MQHGMRTCCRKKTHCSTAVVPSPPPFSRFKLKLLLLAVDEILSTVWICGIGKPGAMQPRLSICFIRFKLWIFTFRAHKHFAMSTVQDDKSIEDFFDESSTLAGSTAFSECLIETRSEEHT